MNRLLLGSEQCRFTSKESKKGSLGRDWNNLSMKKTLQTTRKRGDTITIGDSTIEFVECERGRVRVKVVHEEDTKVEFKIVARRDLRTSQASV